MEKEHIRYLDIWTARKISGDPERTDFSREELDEYTEGKLRETVRYAVENSVFYREKFSRVSADDSSFMEYFRNLPFTTSEELRNRGMDFLCVSPGQISRIVTLDTGGSTGEPKRVHFTEEDQQLTVDYFENGMQLLVDCSDKVLILMPAKMPGSIGRLLSEGLRNFGADTVDYGLPETEAEMQPLLELMKEQHVTSVVALPTHMRMLAEHAAKEADSDSGCVLKNVLLSAEYVPEDTVKLIRDVFGCTVYEHYGMTEMGLGCAVSCGQGEGYHVRECDLYIEIIDPETGETVPDGQPGEVVFTTLTRKGMPFIRYRTGDHSRWITDECQCGSRLKRLDKVGPRDAVKGYLKQQ
ncbi:MAG: DVU_1553 family AMP-dependent CoA ligase [Lentihominibacter sp.]